MTEKVVPEGKYADVGDGLQMHYQDVGTGTKGTLLFIHGSGPGASGYSNFKGNYPFLVEQGYRCLVIDTLGFGYSSKPEEFDYSLPSLAARTKKLVDQAGVTKIIPVGNSQGGAICIRFALDYPEMVEKLVLMAPGGLEDREVYMAMKGIRAMAKTVYKLGITRESMKELFKLQLYRQDLITDQTIEERYSVAITQPKDIMMKLKVDNQEHEIENLACPVLCFWGVNDDWTPMSGAIKIAQRVKNSRTVLISECGHWVMVEYQKLFNETTLKFLNEDLG
jgi:4,5:9,10-diseco-3-hydroxy-5,9,17-trioxoandrosta-1(10),2-diene-4-oate hydrolase